MAEAEDAKRREGFTAHPKSRFGVRVVYTMNDLRADVDGPGKRVLDSIAAGLGFNDSRVDVFIQERKHEADTGKPIVGIPGMDISVWMTFDGGSVAPEPEVVDDEWSIRPGESYVDDKG